MRINTSRRLRKSRHVFEESPLLLACDMFIWRQLHIGLKWCELHEWQLCWLMSMGIDDFIETFEK